MADSPKPHVLIVGVGMAAISMEMDLRRKGYEVKHVDNEEAALASLRAKPAPDALVIGDMDTGPHAIMRAALAQNADMPIAILTRGDEFDRGFPQGKHVNLVNIRKSALPLEQMVETIINPALRGEQKRFLITGGDQFSYTMADMLSAMGHHVDLMPNSLAAMDALAKQPNYDGVVSTLMARSSDYLTGEVLKLHPDMKLVMATNVRGAAMINVPEGKNVHYMNLQRQYRGETPEQKALAWLGVSAPGHAPATDKVVGLGEQEQAK